MLMRGHHPEHLRAYLAGDLGVICIDQNMPSSCPIETKDIGVLPPSLVSGWLGGSFLGVSIPKHFQPAPKPLDM